MSLKSADGEDGFPGEVEVNITYQLTNDNKLKITYAAETRQKPTPINLSSRIFFNLAGMVSGKWYHIHGFFAVVYVFWILLYMCSHIFISLLDIYFSLCIFYVSTIMLNLIIFNIMSLFNIVM